MEKRRGGDSHENSGKLSGSGAGRVKPVPDGGTVGLIELAIMGRSILPFPMAATSSARYVPGRTESGLALAAFAVCLTFHFCAALVGWQSKNLPGVEYRQAQTALSALFIKQDHDFSLAYPTPVLGKPWSVPMEFPLYQWTVVAVSNGTGLGLAKSGRLVSLACFYLMLPAIFLLLSRWRVAPGHRWLVLAAVVTCPLYIFYGRAFLIETMALMFSLWFWVAFERAVAERSRLWLAVAIVTGTGAGLVKVTTFLLYLLPAALWAAGWLWQHRTDGRWRSGLAWMAAAVVVPVAATVGWVHFSDSVKARNPAAQFLVSDRMTDFNLGTNATRFSPELWALKGRIVADQLSWLPLLAGCALLALLAARHRWREIVVCAGVFAAALVIFPELYAYHEYYYVANTVLLMLALGLVLVALAESVRPRWVVALAVLMLAGGQAYAYFDRYYPVQSGISPGGNGLSSTLHALTAPDEVIVIVGQDWNSMTPYYAQRRALMLRGQAEQDPPVVEAALQALAGEKIGALVVGGSLEDRAGLIQRMTAFGLEPSPLYFWRETAVFLPVARHRENEAKLEELSYEGIRPAPGVGQLFPDVTNGWYQVAQLRPFQRGMFDGMKPEPVRFFSTYGLALNRSGGRKDFGAHPVMRLVFALPAGRHVLRTTARFSPDAYRADLAAADRTDGVEVTLSTLGPDDTRRVLDTRILDPNRGEAERVLIPVRIEFALPQASEVELFVGPGPNGRSTRDWVVLGRLQID